MNTVTRGTSPRVAWAMSPATVKGGSRPSRTGRRGTPVIGQHLMLEAGKAMAAGRRAGLDIAPEHAIAWVTLNAARVLGLEDRIGSLEAGKNADLVIWSGDPFSVYTHADEVFLDGARVFDRNAHVPRSDFEVGQPAQGSPP